MVELKPFTSLLSILFVSSGISVIDLGIGVQNPVIFLKFIP